MADQDDMSTWKSSTRGDSAWKEARERVASRNEAARKSGKQERETYERGRASVRQAAERRRHALLLDRRRTP
jgi:hypothetical protein